MTCMRMYVCMCTYIYILYRSKCSHYTVHGIKEDQWEEKERKRIGQYEGKMLKAHRLLA